MSRLIDINILKFDNKNLIGKLSINDKLKLLEFIEMKKLKF